MSSQARPGAVIYAKSLPRVSGFYAGVIGLDIVRSESDHVVLESPLYQLVVLSIPEAIASTIQISSPPLQRTGAAIKLVFVVPSIAACREAAAKLGGEIHPPEREWRFHGAIVCDCHDPEGNVLQLRQSAGQGA